MLRFRDALASTDTPRSDVQAFARLLLERGSAMLGLALRYLVFVGCLPLSIGAIFPVPKAQARLGHEISMPLSVQPVAADAAFGSTKDAEDFLARILPTATANNPKYRSGADGGEMAWITREIKFERGKEPGEILISTSEDVLEFRNGARTGLASHQVAFSIADVKISEQADKSTLTENGEIARGIIFNCNSGGCIRSIYDSQSSFVDATDISIQDDALRGRILQAFEALKKGASDRQPPADAKSP